jgi:hypothetical protein
MWKDFLSFSRQPNADPVITPRFYTDEWDTDVGVALANQSRVMFETAPFQSIIETAVTGTVPANATYAQWVSYVNSTSYVSVLSASLLCEMLTTFDRVLHIGSGLFLLCPGVFPDVPYVGWNLGSSPSRARWCR